MAPEVLDHHTQASSWSGEEQLLSPLTLTNLLSKTTAAQTLDHLSSLVACKFWPQTSQPSCLRGRTPLQNLITQVGKNAAPTPNQV